MRKRVLRALYPVMFEMRQLVWRVTRPQTYGVRVLIRKPGTDAILLVRHTYGPRDRWYPPGGGYNPKRETAGDAARREVREEVGLTLGPLTRLGLFHTQKGGNRDEVALYLAHASDEPIVDPAEIAEYRWVDPHDLAALRLSAITQDIISRATADDVQDR